MVSEKYRVRRRWWYALVLVPLAAVAMVHLHAGEPLRAVTATRQPIQQRVVVSGRVLAAAKVDLGAVDGSRVAEVHVRAGGMVERGELLISLEAHRARAAVARAEARVARARARLGEIRAYDVRLAERHLVRAETELRLARAEHERVGSLAQVGVMTLSQKERAASVLARAKEQYDSARLRLANARPSGGAGKAASAALAQAQAELAAARAGLQDAAIKAPAAGVILTRDVEPGDVVEGGRRLMTFAAHGPIRLQAHPDERALGIVRVGQHATASAEAFPGETFHAEVEWIAPSVDERRGTIEIRLVVPRPPAYLRPDMTVSIAIDAGAELDAIVVPTELVQERDSHAPWVTVVRDGQPQRRAVRLGLRSTGQVQILEGLAEGDEIAVPEGLGQSGPKIHPWD